MIYECPDKLWWQSDVGEEGCGEGVFQYGPTALVARWEDKEEGTREELDVEDREGAFRFVLPSVNI